MTDTSRPQTRDPYGANTRWTMIRRASGGGGGPAEHAEAAWRDLIERYREPVESSIRRQLVDPREAEEITESFFAYLFEKQLLTKADPDQGRFRCFIQGVIRRFVKQELRRRRPAGVAVPDDHACFDRASLEEREERDWARTVLAHSIDRLLEASARDGVLLLRYYGIEPFSKSPPEELCAGAGLNRNALNQALHKARRRLGGLIKSEVQDTVVGARDFDDEMAVILQHLIDLAPGLFS